MRVFCVLVLFISVAFCSTTEEVTEYCEEQCKDVCYICTEPVRCTENQTDCGLGKPDPAFGGVCPPHSICVNKEFNCNSTNLLSNFKIIIKIYSLKNIIA